jgi:hypothetical protein
LFEAHADGVYQQSPPSQVLDLAGGRHNSVSGLRHPPVLAFRRCGSRPAGSRSPRSTSTSCGPTVPPSRRTAAGWSRRQAARGERGAPGWRSAARRAGRSVGQVAPPRSSRRRAPSPLASPGRLGPRGRFQAQRTAGAIPSRRRARGRGSWRAAGRLPPPRASVGRRRAGARAPAPGSGCRPGATGAPQAPSARGDCGLAR